MPKRQVCQVVVCVVVISVVTVGTLILWNALTRCEGRLTDVVALTNP